MLVDDRDIEMVIFKQSTRLIDRRYADYLVIFQNFLDEVTLVRIILDTQYPPFDVAVHDISCRGHRFQSMSFLNAIIIPVMSAR